MPRKPSGRPTDAELAILSALWSRGPSTVREVHATLSRDSKVGYTTVLKHMQIMTEKGLLERDDSTRAHVYRASRSSSDTQSNLVRDLATRAFGGSVAKMVQSALSSQPASKSELEEIRNLLDSMSQDKSQNPNSEERSQ